jgi:DNA-binding beta-propeller fold protein YncE
MRKAPIPSRARPVPHWLGIVAVATFVLAADAKGEPTGLETQFRRPIALALSGNARWLFAANRRSGTISVIDTKLGDVVGEVAVGRSLADLVSLPGERLLAVDEA